MKKTLSLLAVFAVAGMMSAPAQAADQYVSAFAGASWMDKIEARCMETEYEDLDGYNLDMSGGFTGTLAIGCDYGSTRLEAELGYQSNEIDQWSEFEDGVASTFEDNDYDDESTGDVSIYSLMVNGYYDIDLGGAELYAMAGVGVAQVNFEDASIGSEPYNAEDPKTKHETTLAYQLGAGIAIPVSDGVMLDARYRFFATTEASLNPNFDVSSHSALLGLRVNL